VLVPAPPFSSSSRHGSSSTSPAVLPDTLACLLTFGGNGSAVDALGWQPFHWAVARGDTAAAAVLLAEVCRCRCCDGIQGCASLQPGDGCSGCEGVPLAVAGPGMGVNVVTEREGWTPLHLAVMVRNKKLAQMLLQAPACEVRCCMVRGAWQGGGRMCIRARGEAALLRS
jgi:ankyrin repeat protein